jgi:hypothetical protein
VPFPQVTVLNISNLFPELLNLKENVDIRRREMLMYMGNLFLGFHYNI